MPFAVELVGAAGSTSRQFWVMKSAWGVGVIVSVGHEKFVGTADGKIVAVSIGRFAGVAGEQTVKSKITVNINGVNTAFFGFIVDSLLGTVSVSPVGSFILGVNNISSGVTRIPLPDIINIADRFSIISIVCLQCVCHKG